MVSKMEWQEQQAVHLSLIIVHSRDPAMYPGSHDDLDVHSDATTRRARSSPYLLRLTLHFGLVLARKVTMALVSCFHTFDEQEAERCKEQAAAGP